MNPNRGVRKSGHLQEASAALLQRRLGELLRRKGITGNELAKRSNLPRSTVAQLLNGETTPRISLGHLVRLTRGFGLRSVEELISPLGTAQLRDVEFPGDDAVA